MSQLSRSKIVAEGHGLRITQEDVDGRDCRYVEAIGNSQLGGSLECVTDMGAMEYMDGREYPLSGRQLKFLEEYLEY